MLWTSFKPVQFASKYGTPTPGFINFLTSKSPWCNTLIRAPQLLVLNLVEVPCRFQNGVCFGGMAPDTSSLRAFKDADLGRLAIVVFLSNRSQTITDTHICTIAPTSHLHHCYAIAVVIKNRNCHQMVLNRFNVSGQHHNVQNAKETILWSEEQISRTKTDPAGCKHKCWQHTCLITMLEGFASGHFAIEVQESISGCLSQIYKKPYDENIHLDPLKFAPLVV